MVSSVNKENSKTSSNRRIHKDEEMESLDDMMPEDVERAEL